MRCRRILHATARGWANPCSRCRGRRWRRCTRRSGSATWESPSRSVSFSVKYPFTEMSDLSSLHRLFLRALHPSSKGHLPCDRFEFLYMLEIKEYRWPSEYMLKGEVESTERGGNMERQEGYCNIRGRGILEYFRKLKRVARDRTCW
jgi:hypothetical protein